LLDRAIVLAIGNPNHQSQLIYNRPRAMLPVLGKPLVARAMERLYRAGIQKFTVVVGAEEGAVAAYLNAHWLSNVSLEFVIQPDHASLTQSLVEVMSRYDQPFLLATYNSLTHANFPENLLERYKNTDEELVICAAPTTLSKSDPTAYGLTENQMVTKIVHERPDEQQSSLLLIGLARCGMQFVHYLTQPGLGSRNQVMDIFTDYVETGGKTLVAETAWVLPVETDYDLLTVNKLLLNDGLDTYILSDIPRSVEIIPPVRVDPKVSIAVGAKIGPHVYLELGCSVGPNAVLNNAVVLENAVVPAGSIWNDVVVSSRSTIQG
jgi:NDP-sugar pyrophosphorylase family protein